MPDDINDIQAFYDGAIEQEDIRLQRHQLERDITWRYLEKYLPPSGSVLDIGAGTGAYAIPLAKRGYKVTAVDLSSKLIELCQKRVSAEGLEKNVRFFVADTRDLSDIKDSDFDAVLLMGPLYHLVLEEDRKTALGEAYNRLKRGGIIFSAFISRYGIWGNVMKNIPESIEDQVAVRSVLDSGRDPEGTQAYDFRAYFAKVSEIAPLHEEIGFKTLVLAGVEPAISADDESYNKLEGTRRKLWFDLLYELSKEQSIIAASQHLLYIGVKPG
jgi:S-adenosylmethionine-dependent methyltransferase